MVLPGILGFWIDYQLGTVMVFLVLGVILGVTTGMIHLVRLTSSTRPGSQQRDRKSTENKSLENKSESSPRT